MPGSCCPRRGERSDGDAQPEWRADRNQRGGQGDPGREREEHVLDGSVHILSRTVDREDGLKKI